MFTYEVPLPTSYEVVEMENYVQNNTYELEEIIDEQEKKEDEKVAKPLDKITVTSGYGNRTNPITKKQEFHHGVDIVGGTKIYATADGKVVKVVNKGSKGGVMCLVRIQHKDYQSAYYHIASGSARVKVGDWVKKGDWIATVGATGQATGKHLHFQIDKGSNSTSINPTAYAKGTKELKGLTKPTKEWEKGDYKVLKEKYVRTSAEVKTTNKMKYNTLLPEMKALCVKDSLGYAKFKIGATVYLDTFKSDSKNNIWGKRPGRNTDTWLCVEDTTGYQVEKV